jgi:hypothetical protein
MRLTSPRADSLERIRDLVILIDRGEILGLKGFNRYLEEKFDWKRGRRYHYRAALEDFGLVRMSSLGWVLSETAKRLARINNYQDFKSLGLNAEEKEIFADILVTYRHSACFLGLFMPSGKPPETVAHFREASQWISIVSTNNSVEFYRGQESYNISSQQARAFRWTIKGWLKTVGLIDEFEIEPTKFIDSRDTHVLFPIKSSLDSITYETFRSWVELTVQSKDRIVRIPIPVLMHRVCTQHYIPVKDFQKGIEKLYRREPHRFRLEKISSIYINETYDRIKNYSNYPKIDGTYRGIFAIVSTQEQEHNGR